MGKKINLLFLIILISGCSNPFAALEDPVKYSGLWSEKWVLYDEKLNTEGGIMLFPSVPENGGFSIEEKDDKTAYSGSKYLRLNWNGCSLWWEANPPDNPSSRYEYSFAGVSFIVATSPYFYEITPGRDLSESGYKKVVVYIRGSLDNGYYVKLEAPGGTSIENITPTPVWRKYEVDIYNLFKIKDFFKITIYYPSADTNPPGKGGYIDIDMLYYER